MGEKQKRDRGGGEHIFYILRALYPARPLRRDWGRGAGAIYCDRANSITAATHMHGLHKLEYM